MTRPPTGTRPEHLAARLELLTAEKELTGRGDVSRVRSQPAAFAGLLIAAAGSWWLTAERMAGMNAGPGAGLGALGWFLGVWTLMMAAMMLPSLAPAAAAHATAARRRDPSSWLLFAAGYLLLWALAGLLAYALFALGRDLYARQLAWHSGGRWLATAILGLGALYELSPPKRACLLRCRDAPPRASGGHARRRSPEFTSGLRNGCWCVGCSWALMAALFALGPMSLTWMALVAAMVTVEKLSPRPAMATALTAVVLAALAVGLLLAPGAVPGFVVPVGHPMRAMRLG